MTGPAAMLMPPIFFMTIATALARSMAMSDTARQMLAKPVAPGGVGTLQIVLSASVSSTTTEDAPIAKVARPSRVARIPVPGW